MAGVYPLSPTVCERTARQYESFDSVRMEGQRDPNAREWRALLQRIEPMPPTSFRD